jgi:hypothetical protein
MPTRKMLMSLGYYRAEGPGLLRLGSAGTRFVPLAAVDLWRNGDLIAANPR